MKEQELINKIENQAKIFKSRATIGHEDEKRHDLIKPDEQKYMWTAHNKLGWSYPKIGSVFDRDPRTVKKHIEDTQRNLKIRKEKQPESEQPPALRIKQQEHIKTLQQVARTALDNLPADFPDLKNDETFVIFNETIVKIYRRLTGDFDWESMSAHLGDEGKMIEKISSQLDHKFPGPIYNPCLTQYKKDLEEAFFVIKTGGLRIISEDSDTRRWEYAGLNQRCKNCPDQSYEPWGEKIEDYTREYGPYPTMTFKDLHIKDVQKKYPRWFTKLR